jgi:hypothetical protein
MSKLVLAFAFSLLACTAMAARPSTLNMTCGQARGLVATQGAIVLTTGRHTFDRFVADAGFCEWDEYADWAYAPTRDTPQCPVGYTCRYRPAPWEDF